MKRNTTDNKMICIVFALILYAGSFLWLFLPKSEYSAAERRMLASMPKLSADSVWSGRFMSDFENYVSDQFPCRNTLRMAKALAAKAAFFRQDNHGIYAADGHLCAIEYPMNEASLRAVADRFRFIYETYVTDKSGVYLSVIPDKNCFLAKENGRPYMDYEEFEQKMAQLAYFAQYIKISDLLEKDDYYKTDTHWRQEKILDVADRLAQSMNTSPVRNVTAHRLDNDFYGVYYGQAALPFAPDHIRYFTNEAITGCKAYDWESNQQIPVYDKEKAAGRDGYEMFLAGARSLITMENPKAQTGRKLVLFRDSFGSSIAPLLLDGYEKITLVDIRYMKPEILYRFVDFSNSDVLFLYSTLVLNHSDTFQ